MQVGFREHPALKRVRAKLPGVHMLLAPEQAHFTALLARLLGGSALSQDRYLYRLQRACHYARAGTPDGRVLTCEIDASMVPTAQRHWQLAGVANKIELRLGPALNTLDASLAQGEHGRFDLAFIDADKESLLAYYERCHALVRLGGRWRRSPVCNRRTLGRT